MDEKVRTYGLFRKTPEDKTRCIESVHGGGRWPVFYQCHRRRGFGSDGLYCKIHSPEEVEKRQKKSAEKFNRKLMNFEAPYKKIEELETNIKMLREEVGSVLNTANWNGPAGGYVVAEEAWNRLREIRDGGVKK